MRTLIGETFISKTNSVKIGIRNDCLIENFTSSFGEVFFLIDGMNEIKDVSGTFNRAASSIKKHIILNPNQTLNPNQIIEESIETSDSLREYVIEKKSIQNESGSIFLLIRSLEGAVYFNYYGDSILYLIRGNLIYNLESIGHSEKGFDYGRDISYDENDGLITYKDDKLLLCSYQMTEVLNDKVIFNIVNDLQPKQACEELLDLSNIFGCNDYMSVQIFHMLRSSQLSRNSSNVKPDEKFQNKKINKKGEAIISSIEDISKAKNENDIQECFNVKKRRKQIPKYLSIGGIILSLILMSVILEFEVLKNNKTIVGNTQTTKKNKVLYQATNDIKKEIQLREIMKEKSSKESVLSDEELNRLDTNILMDIINYKTISNNILYDNEIKKLINDLRDSKLICKDSEKIRYKGQDYLIVDLIMTENGNIMTLTLVKEGGKYKISKMLFKQDLNKLRPINKLSNTKFDRSFKNNERFGAKNKEFFNNEYKEEKKELNYSKRVILDDRILK